MSTMSKTVLRMLGFKRVLYLAAMLTIAPAGLMACNEDEDEQTPPDGSGGDDAGSDRGDVEVDAGDVDGGAETDAGFASELGT
jgi:hypothetical protein